MRKLTYYVASTIDGFVAGPDGGDPSGPGGFWAPGEDYVGHMVANYPETLPGPAHEPLGITEPGTRFDTVVEGRASYQIGLDAGVPDAYPHLHHVVFSRTLESVPATDVELVSTDPVEKVRELKQQAGKGIWLVGGGTLAGTLYDEIDELIIKLSPITVGTGIGLFGAHAKFEPANWELTDTAALPSGVFFLTYYRKK